jgi:DNA polymerase-1
MKDKLDTDVVCTSLAQQAPKETESCAIPNPPSIPLNFPPQPYEAAMFYWQGLGWAVQPLYGQNARNCGPKQAGKAPILENWTSHTANQITEPLLAEWFNGEEYHNVGVVVRPPYIVVDLDSKHDQGDSVRKWLATQNNLANVPMEETTGGAHLHLICRDLPVFKNAAGRLYKKALACKVNEHVDAELFFNGQNIVVSPSIHPSGKSYSWRVTGPIPEISWQELQQVFAFKAPQSVTDEEDEKEGKKSSWWNQFKGNLATLDIVKLFQTIGLYGTVVQAEEGKHSVQCPWCEMHSDRGENWRDTDTSSVIFTGEEGHWPGWSCLHQSHGEKSLENLLNWVEEQHPGLVDSCCAEMRVWAQGQKDRKGRTRIVLSGPGKELSRFAFEVGSVIGPTGQWFTKGQDVVEIREEKVSGTVKTLAFHTLGANETRTVIEDYIQTGYLKTDEHGNSVYVQQSMSRETAAALLASPQLRRALPHIERILDVPVPVMWDSQLVFVQRGYDERLKTYCPGNGPEIAPLSLEESKAVLHELTQDFCFADAQSVTNFIARLLTPFCRGLMGWSARPPIWLFEGNRPRAGKDYLAMIIPMVYEGRPNEDAPMDVRPEETGKRIVAALRAGRRFMHFANCRGHIDNFYVEQAATAKVLSARSLGSNDASSDLTLPNELELSLSTNTGTTFTEDFGLRCRHISLHYAEEDANARHFRNPDLHAHVLASRGRILSALAGLVYHWNEKGRPNGPTNFTSFPEWARVVGGILWTCGLGDPCITAKGQTLTGDSVTEDMRKLFGLGFEKHPGKWIGKPEVYALITDNDEEELFHWWDLTARGDQTAFSLKYRGFVGRILDGIQLKGRELDKRRPKFMFSRPDQSPKENHSLKVFGELNSCQPSQGCQPHYPPSSLEENNNSKYNINKNITPYIGGEKDATVDILDTTKERTASSAPQTTQLQLVIVHDDQPVSTPWQNVPASVLYKRIESREGLTEVVNAIVNSSTIALDLETYGREDGDGLNPRRGDIRLLTLTAPEHPIFIIDLKMVGYQLGELGRLLAKKPLIIHNAKFDLSWLKAKCNLHPKRITCTMTLARLLNAGSDLKANLAECLSRFLGVAVDKAEQLSDWSAPVLSDSQYSYAARDVSHLHALAGALESEIEKAALRAVADLENALIPLVCDMEANGFCVDKEKLLGIALRAQEQADQWVPRVCEALQKTDLNPASPKQLLEAFAALGIDLEGTNEETLTGCTHPAAQLILEWRGYEKAAGSANTYLQAIDPDGRIHASFNPTGSAAGRFSCKEPNLQNVGRDKDLRSCFKAGDGKLLVVADFSQIELRAAAVIAPDKKLLDAYLNGLDVHTQTAALVLKKDVAAVTKEDRQLAKAVNFGLLYGQSAEGLCQYAKTSYGVKMTVSEATTFRNRFFMAYQGLAKWHERTKRAASADLKETRTLLGRRRLLKGGPSNWWLRFSSGVNSPVQGTCADGFKLALVKLSEELPKEVKIISTVHDEIILESPRAMAQGAAETMKRCMIEAMSQVLQGVPIEVGVSIGPDWASK